MQTLRTTGLVLLGAIISAGVHMTRETLRAQDNRPQSRITVSAIDWSSGQPFRYFFDDLTKKCYFAALNPRDTTIAAMVEAPGACQ